MTFKFETQSLAEFLLKATPGEILEVVEDIHPADILDAIRNIEDEKSSVLIKLPEEIIADVIDEAEDEEKYELFAIFSEAKQKNIVDDMSSDELADLLGNMEPEEADKILSKMNKEDAEEVKELMTYDPDTAGGIMATEFISIRENMTIAETFKYLQIEAPDAETAYYIYVLDEKDVLKGVVSMRDLVVSSFETKIIEIMNDNVISVPVSMDQEEVGHKFEKYGFLTMPVVSEDNKMLGVITVDDVMQILRDETTEDIHRLAGLGEGEKVTGSLVDSVKSRLPWLMINLGTAILASMTVNLFQGAIQKVVILAAFMPIVSGMGGNAGTQTLTIIVRGIALGEVTFKNAKKILVKEIGVGLIDGLGVGMIVAIIGYLWVGKAIFGLVIGMAMILNMTVATLAGFVVPIILKKLKVDPALASAVFVTTVTDVCGFFFFLGLASIFISYLI